MCLIFLAWRVNADYPLVVAANRDELLARPGVRERRAARATGHRPAHVY